MTPTETGAFRRAGRIAALVLAAAFLLAAPPPCRGGQMLQDGDPFPSWELVDHTGKRVSADDLKGRSYLLWFYPRASTPGCTVEGRELRDRFDEFEKSDVEVLGVSFDDPKDNARFVAEEKFPFRLLSDEDRKLAVAVGAADSTDQAFARRISYLVGPDGRVRRAYPDVRPKTHAAGVLTDLVSPAAGVP